MGDKRTVITRCTSCGTAVASDIRGPGLESGHRKFQLNIYFPLTVHRGDEKEEKEAVNDPLEIFKHLTLFLYLL